MIRDQFRHWSRMLSRFLFFPAICVVVWGQLRHGELPPGVGAEDKVLHFVAYFGLSVLVTVALDGRKILYAALGLILLGAAMEFIQGMTGRDAELLDQLANTMGVICGLVVGYAWIRLTAGQPLAAPDGRR